MLKKYLLVGLVLAIIGGISLYAWAFVRGTTSPQGFFHIQGKDDTAEKVIFIQGNDTPDDGKPTSLKFGIGTTNPSFRLSVEDARLLTSGEHFLADFRTNSAVLGNAQILLGYRADGTSVTENLVRSANNLPLTFGTSDTTQAVTILNNGNVGIGTTGPGERLTIAGVN